MEEGEEEATRYANAEIRRKQRKGIYRTPKGVEGEPIEAEGTFT